MRVTVSVPDAVGAEAEQAARSEGKSVSALYASAMEAYLRERRQRLAVERIGARIGKATVASEALEELERERGNSERDLA